MKIRRAGGREMLEVRKATLTNCIDFVLAESSVAKEKNRLATARTIIAS